MFPLTPRVLDESSISKVCFPDCYNNFTFFNPIKVYFVSLSGSSIYINLTDKIQSDIKHQTFVFLFRCL